MVKLPDFNLGNWVNRFEQGYIAVPISNPTQKPIPDVIVPYTFSEQYVRIRVKADFYTQRWVQGLVLKQTIPTFLGNFDVVDTKLIKLWEPQIIELKTYPDGYKLKLEFYRWFRDIDVLIHAWQPPDGYNPNPVDPNSPFILGL